MYLKTSSFKDYINNHLGFSFPMSAHKDINKHIYISKWYLLSLRRKIGN